MFITHTNISGSNLCWLGLIAAVELRLNAWTLYIASIRPLKFGHGIKVTTYFSLQSTGEVVL
jgi:hypothetical protein